MVDLGLPRWCSGKESAYQWGRYRRCRFNPWVGKIPWRRKWQPTPVVLPGKLHGQRSLEGYNPWGCKELGMTEWLNTDTTHGRSALNFLKRFHVVFHSGWTSVHSHQWWARVPFSPDPHQHLFSLVFLMIAVLTSVRLYLSVAFTCTCLMINDVNIFPCTCWPFECHLWKKVYFVPLPILKFGLFEGFCYWVIIWVLYIFYQHIV